MILIALFVLLCVSVWVLARISGDPRPTRIGATLLPCWIIGMIAIELLEALDQPLLISGTELIPGLYALGIGLVAWAMLDSSKLTRRYGTTKLDQAVATVRGMLLDHQSATVIWAHWVRELPLPAWIKAPGGAMLAINPAYEKRYGVPREMYAAVGDDAVWSTEVARAFADNDAAVVLTGKPWVGKEPAPSLRDPSHVADVVKFPARVMHHGSAVGGIEIGIELDEVGE